ncbi:MAG: EndoU domain-containing protein [Ruminococcus sp.]|nr:EndoU domain-containing protein [Ruminococcus sp.]
MMKNKLITTLSAAIIILTLIFSGCSAGNLIDYSSGSSQTNVTSQADKSSKAKTDGSSKAKTDGKDESDGTAKTTYKMSDIYKLKNTGHFAKNTLKHIFDGTINSKGKATGYHYSMVEDSKGSIIDGTRSKEDKNGVFTGKVKVGDVKKNGFSSFYPESWTPQQVVDAINTAYDYAINDSSNPKGSLWIGYADDLEIDMYLDNNKKITTAYPVYEGD